MFLLWKDFSCNLGSLRLPKKTIIVISAECIYKFVTNLMVFIKGLLIQLFLSFDAEKLINQLFNPNFFYTAFFPLFLWLCHFHKGFWLYLRRNWISGICQDVSVFFVLFLLPTAAKPDEWGDFSYFSDIDNGILLPKLFVPTVRKNVLGIEAEGREFAKISKSLKNLFSQ